MTRRIFAITLASLVLLTACAEDERRELRLTRTSTVETGVRILADNCPGPSNVALLIRDDVLWEIQAPAEPAGEDTEADSGELSEDEAAITVQPGLIEFLVGQTPNEWDVVTPLTATVEPGTRYTIRTRPDGQTIDFSTPDLQAGLLWDGTGVTQFNPNLINVECGVPTDVGAFAFDLAILLALGTTTAAFALVTLILVLFVITSRFSRIRSIQKKAQREADHAAGISPAKTRSQLKKELKRGKS